MGAAAGLVGIGTAVMVAVPGLRMLGFPLWSEPVRGSGTFLPAGPPSLFAGTEPVKVELRADVIDAWNRRVQVKVGSAWVLPGREGTLRALSTVCPHLGCGIDYVAEKRKFLCACHKSWFDIDGSLEEGPSPRGMDELEIKAGDKLVEIRHQRFVQGVDTKVPV